MEANLPFYKEAFISYGKEEDKKLMEAFSNSCVAIAFLCLHFDSTIEYVLSIANVDRNNNKRNLGGLVVGYTSQYQLKPEDRILLNIVSDQLTSVVAGQWLFENNKEFQREYLRKRLVEALNTIQKGFDTNALHGKQLLTEAESEKLSKVCTEFSDVLTTYFTKAIDTLRNENNSFISKYHLIQLKNRGDCEECKITNPLSIFNDTDKGTKCCSSIANFKLINVPFVEALFNTLLVKEHGNTATVATKTVTEHDEMIFMVTYSTGFNVAGFVEALKADGNGTFVGKFCKDLYPILDCHGIFIIKAIDDDSKEFEFFNSRNTIKEVREEEGQKKLILNDSYEFPNIDKATSLKLIFKNELSL